METLEPDDNEYISPASAAALATAGQIDILVNNVGAARGGDASGRGQAHSDRGGAGAGQPGGGRGRESAAGPGRGHWRFGRGALSERGKPGLGRTGQ